MKEPFIEHAGEPALEPAAGRAEAQQFLVGDRAGRLQHRVVER
jgi:hypothetical protein